MVHLHALLPPTGLLVVQHVRAYSFAARISESKGSTHAKPSEAGRPAGQGPPPVRTRIDSADLDTYPAAHHADVARTGAHEADTPMKRRHRSIYVQLVLGLRDPRLYERAAVALLVIGSVFIPLRAASDVYTFWGSIGFGSTRTYPGVTESEILRLIDQLWQSLWVLSNALHLFQAIALPLIACIALAHYLRRTQRPGRNADPGPLMREGDSDTG